MGHSIPVDHSGDVAVHPLADLLEQRLDALVGRWRARLGQAGDLAARLGPAIEDRGRLYVQSLVGALRGTEDGDRRTARFFFGSREGARPATDDELAASAAAVELLQACVDEVAEGRPVRLHDVRRLGELLRTDVHDLHAGATGVGRGDGLAMDPTAVGEPERLFQHFRWHDITGPRRAEELLAFVAEASRLLASSLDYEETLHTLTEIAVPAMADCCSIEMLVAPRTTRILAIKHVDPRKIDVIHRIYRDYPTPFDAPGGAPHIIRTGTSALIEDLPPELFKLVSKDEEHLRLNLSLGIRSSMGVPILARGEVFGAMVLMCSEESDRRLTRADLALAEELGRRAGLAVANARLYAEAQRAIELRDDFITVASHELRTPMHTAQLQLGALIHAVQHDAGGRPPLERLRKLDAQLGRLHRLVEHLLDASRLREVRLELSRRDADLGHVARDVAQQLAELAAKAGASVDVRVEGDATGHWDPERLEQVVTNLLDNAIKFGAGKPIEIVVDGRGDEVVLQVVDRGIGLAAEDIERIFERFARAVSVRSFGGLGLGLWIVEQVVLAHGGSLRVESTPGEGSTFGVVLPRRAPVEDEQ